MSEERIIRHTRASLPEDTETDWDRIRAMTEEEVMEAALAGPGAQPTDAQFWEHATLVMPEPKERITLRVDKDVLEWFKRECKGYQTRMNAVLRMYMEAQKPKD